MIELKLQGSVQYISKGYYEVLCKTEKGYEIVKIQGHCPYTMEQKVTLDCTVLGVEIIGEYYELIAREKRAV